MRERDLLLFILFLLILFDIFNSCFKITILPLLFTLCRIIFIQIS